MTKQIEDKVVYKGNEYYITCEFELEEYMHKNVSIPPLNVGGYTYTMTACYRGYFARFEILNDKLYLKAINGEELNEFIEYTGTLALISGYEIIKKTDLHENSTLLPLEAREKYVLRLYFVNGKIVKKEKL